MLNIVRSTHTVRNQMLAFISLLFTSVAVVLSSMFFGYYALYYGVYRPTKMFLRLLSSLFYYAIMLAGLYFIVTTLILPHLPAMDSNRDSAEDDAEGGNGMSSNGLKEAAGTYANIFLQCAKVVVRAVASLIVAVVQ